MQSVVSILRAQENKKSKMNPICLWNMRLLCLWEMLLNWLLCIKRKSLCQKRGRRWDICSDSSNRARLQEPWCFLSCGKVQYFKFLCWHQAPRFIASHSPHSGSNGPPLTDVVTEQWDTNTKYFSRVHVSKVTCWRSVNVNWEPAQNDKQTRLSHKCCSHMDRILNPVCLFHSSSSGQSLGKPTAFS